MNEKELQRILTQPGYSVISDSGAQVSGAPAKSRFNSVLTTVDDTKFRSSGEAARYMVLKRYVEMGILCDLTLQPQFILQDRFVLDGKVILPITYKADFRYTYHSEEWVEDWKRKQRDGKPFMTEDFKRTYKLFKARYAQVHFWINCDAAALPPG